MATKKKRPAKKSKSRSKVKATAAREKAAKSKGAKAQRTKSKPARSTKSAKSSKAGTTRSKTPAKKQTPISVDSLLKKFGKDRIQKESQLAAMKKKRTDLQDKADKIRQQITQISQQITETETTISKLDSQRDIEVKELLTRLGVRIDAVSSTTGGSNAQVQPSRQAQHSAPDRGKVSREKLTFANGREDS